MNLKFILIIFLNLLCSSAFAYNTPDNEKLYGPLVLKFLSSITPVDRCNSDNPYAGAYQWCADSKIGYNRGNPLNSEVQCDSRYPVCKVEYTWKPKHLETREFHSLTGVFMEPPEPLGGIQGYKLSIDLRFIDAESSPGSTKELRISCSVVAKTEKDLLFKRDFTFGDIRYALGRSRIQLDSI